MNKKVFVLFALILITSTNCRNSNNKVNDSSLNENSTAGTAEIVFSEYEHDFGKVSEGEKVAFVFSFENKGTGSLVVKSATTSCGCTIPRYDTKPIPPGGNGNLEVVFDTSEKNGMQTKTISVNSNASKRVVLLKITAEVVTNIN